MKTSFSRSFFTAAAILLLALVVLGTSFQLQVNHYMEDSTVSGLQQDAAVIANLAAAYSMDGQLSSRDLLLNLDIISQVTDADVVICDEHGFIILCSDALTGCDHEGWQLNGEFLQTVISQGSYTATGVIKNLYADERYVVSSPIMNADIARGLVIVSAPTAATNQILNRISNIFLTAAVFVVMMAVLAVTAFARRESRPLRDMAKAANSFAHGNLKARVKLEEDYSEEMEELAIAFNNNMQFFHENHDWYLRAVRQPCLELADALGGVMEQIDEEIERRPNRVVSRINRDIPRDEEASEADFV